MRNLRRRMLCGDLRLRILTQPADVTAPEGATVNFRVVARGRGLTYRWQYRNPSTGVWKNNSAATVGYNTARLQVEATSFRTGYRYRCVVTDAAGASVTSDAALLTVTQTSNAIQQGEEEI